ncbi:hypothetical protein NMY22_g20243 [Coprinellus aureogranulatus]|nr:hypothetical protein NMY22_g20243 [Coprinellus aureogranulatus]
MPVVVRGATTLADWGRSECASRIAAMRSALRIFAEGGRVMLFLLQNLASASSLNCLKLLGASFCFEKTLSTPARSKVGSGDGLLPARLAETLPDEGITLENQVLDERVGRDSIYWHLAGRLDLVVYASFATLFSCYSEHERRGITIYPKIGYPTTTHSDNRQHKNPDLRMRSSPGVLMTLRTLLFSDDNWVTSESDGYWHCLDAPMEVERTSMANSYNHSLKKRYLAIPVSERKPRAMSLRWPEHNQASQDRAQWASSAKISRPPGEAGRPGRGGFNLQKELGWPPSRYQDVQVSNGDTYGRGHDRTSFQRAVRSIALKKLEITKPYTEQNETSLREACDEIVERFAEMNRYDRRWPATEFIKAFLKNAPRYRKQSGNLGEPDS